MKRKRILLVRTLFLAIALAVFGLFLISRVSEFDFSANELNENRGLLVK